MSALIIVLPNKSVNKFRDEFSKYVLQNDEFSKSLEPAFLIPVRSIVGVAAKSARVVASVIFKDEVVTRLSPERPDSHRCSS